jgi:hypothetical protein
MKRSNSEKKFLEKNLIKRGICIIFIKNKNIMSEQTPKTIAVFATEYYETSITREPVELTLADYPELEGMTIEEAIDYVESNAWEMASTNPDMYESLGEELNDMDIRRDKITNETQEVNAVKEMF